MDRNHYHRQQITVVGFGGKLGEDSVLSDIRLVVKNSKFCSAKYTVVPGVSDYFSAIIKSLPEKFNQSTVFCASSEGEELNTCKGDSGKIHIFKHYYILTKVIVSIYVVG